MILKQKKLRSIRTSVVAAKVTTIKAGSMKIENLSQDRFMYHKIYIYVYISI